jgi:hypothetical protein
MRNLAPAIVMDQRALRRFDPLGIDPQEQAARADARGTR